MEIYDSNVLLLLCLGGGGKDFSTWKVIYLCVPLADRLGFIFMSFVLNMMAGFWMSIAPSFQARRPPNGTEQPSHCGWNGWFPAILLGQWLNVLNFLPMAKRLKLFGITYLVGNISRSNFFFQGPGRLSEAIVLILFAPNWWLRTISKPLAWVYTSPKFTDLTIYLAKMNFPPPRYLWSNP